MLSNRQIIDSMKSTQQYGKPEHSFSPRSHDENQRDQAGAGLVEGRVKKGERTISVRIRNILSPGGDVRMANVLAKGFELQPGEVFVDEEAKNPPVKLKENLEKSLASATYGSSICLSFVPAFFDVIEKFLIASPHKVQKSTAAKDSDNAQILQAHFVRHAQGRIKKDGIVTATTMEEVRAQFRFDPQTGALLLDTGDPPNVVMLDTHLNDDTKGDAKQTIEGLYTPFVRQLLKREITDTRIFFIKLFSNGNRDRGALNEKTIRAEVLGVDAIVRQPLSPGDTNLLLQAIETVSAMGRRSAVPLMLFGGPK